MAEEDARSHERTPAPSSPADNSQVVDGCAPARSDVPPKMLHMYPYLIPGVLPQCQEQNGHGPGIYAVPYHPYMGTVAGVFPSSLIPLSYRIPSRTNTSGADGEGHEGRHEQVPQRQVVARRFQFAFQIDLALIIKLAAVVFLFSQEGSRHRFIVLVLFAAFIYLYQTGVLLPLIRWIRQGAAPLHPPPQRRPRIPPADGAPIEQNLINPPPGENVGPENENQPPQHDNQEEANENQAVGFNLWGIVKEIQMVVVGFVASLLPGFHHHDA